MLPRHRLGFSGADRALACLAFALLPALASAQVSGSIAGTVKDATGAVLPGVTVEASSPALIEKVRSVVTDTQGQYKIIELRPGTYVVTFTLPGFSTVRREGLELPTGFTATVDADLKIGSLAETITVSGASPVVDVQNSRTQTVLTTTVLDALPVSKTMATYAAITLGASLSTLRDQDVGGKGEAGAVGGFVVHGQNANDGRLTIDGMRFYSSCCDGTPAVRHTMFNPLALQETTITMSGAGAEYETGGYQMNLVPRDGGNRYSGSALVIGTGKKLQANNLTDALRTAGLTVVSQTIEMVDVAGSLGGPIKTDRLWFFAAGRWWHTKNSAPGIFYNKTQHSFVYTPDLTRPAYNLIRNNDLEARFTWQASEKNKITIYENIQRNCANCFYPVDLSIAAPEATVDLVFKPTLTQVTWTRPATNRLLFEAGTTFKYEPTQIRDSQTSPTDIPITELSTNFQYNARAQTLGLTDYSTDNPNHDFNQRVSVSYVTGSHAFKTGMMLEAAWYGATPYVHDIPGLGPVAYYVRNGVPVQIREFASPLMFRNQIMPNLGIYVQDSWRRGRLTLNPGLRFDWLRQTSSAQTLAAIPAFNIPERTFPKTVNTPNWKDINLRIGGAFDVFGNGRTAIKGSVGRYVVSQLTGIGRAAAAANRLATFADRTWGDADADFFPDCNLKDPLANGECGRLSNVNLGLPIPALTFDPEFIHGWHKRPNMWQNSLILQQELAPGFALNVGYFNHSFGHIPAVTNRAYTAADFDPYCVTAPTDPRLGADSGQTLCGFYEVKSARFGQVDNFLTDSANLGGAAREHYNGVDVGINARFGRGGVLTGGFSTGRTVQDVCDVVQNNPQNLFAFGIGYGAGNINASRAGDSYCHQTVPFRGFSQVKLAGSYPLPWGLNASANFQNLPGLPLAATWVVASAAVAPSLGRPLNTATTTIPIMQAFTQYGERITQLDVRAQKTFDFGRAKLQANIDLFNVFNASTLLAARFTYPASYLQPTAILGGRLLKFSAQLNF